MKTQLQVLAHSQSWVSQQVLAMEKPLEHEYWSEQNLFYHLIISSDDSGIWKGEKQVWNGLGKIQLFIAFLTHFNHNCICLGSTKTASTETIVQGSEEKNLSVSGGYVNSSLSSVWL